MSHDHPGRIRFTEADQERLVELRQQRPALHVASGRASRGQMLADRFAATVGSWPFIIGQTAILAVWVALNVTAYVRHWDPYPFILLNLMLSFQAAYAAPIIMMSQNRQSEIDRRRAEHDYRVNVKAELEIELLHQKIDAMREQELVKLITIVDRLTTQLAPAPEQKDAGRPD